MPGTSTLAAEIRRALVPLYGDHGATALLRMHHEANGVPNGAPHPFYAAAVGDATKDLDYLMLTYYRSL